MKIAISGAHRTGKTTLVEELARALLGYETVDEPYYLLEEEGYEFPQMPSLEDFEMQLERSLESISEAGEDRIFDRCPADIVAYLITHRESGAFDLERWLPRIRRAMAQFDLVVFVPVEAPDRIEVSELDHGELRQRVDEELREILLGDRWSFGVETCEVTGGVQDRVNQVLLRVEGQR